MVTAVRLAGALVLVGSVAVAGQEPLQQPVPPTGLVLGRTVDFSTGKAVGGAIVTIALGAAPGPGPAGPAANASFLRFPIRIVSDGEGRFLFHDLPKGTYALTATKAGYGDTSLGRQSPSDTTSATLTLAAGERKGDVSLVMWKLASISGTVVDEAGEPVLGLPISLMHRTIIGGRARFTQAGSVYPTDDRGTYRAGLLPPGDYVVAIITTETTFSLAWQSATRAALRADSVAVNRELNRSTIAMDAVMTSGQRVGTLSVSGDMGQGVAPPRVVGDRVFVYPTTFYPSAPTPSRATIITVASGEERASVDFQVRPTPTARVSGTVVGSDGPESGIGLELIAATTEEVDRDPPFSVAQSVSDASGAFTLLGVPVGNYLLRVQKNPPQPESRGGNQMVIQTGNGMIATASGGSMPPVTDDPTLWAQLPISVTGPDINGVSVALRNGVRLAGRVQFSGSRPQPTAAQVAAINVTLQAAGGRTQAALTVWGGAIYNTRGSVDANGQFKTYQFPPGRYVVRATAPPGWTFAGATFRGRDIADAPLEVGGEDLTDIVLLMTDKQTELSGNVRAAQGPDAAATVLVFPADATNWVDYGPTGRRLRLVRPSNDGSYRVTALPAGDYLVTAIHSAVPSTWSDPAFLQRVAATATRVTIADGDKKAQDLRSTEVR